MCSKDQRNRGIGARPARGGPLSRGRKADPARELDIRKALRLERHGRRALRVLLEQRARRRARVI